MSKKIAVILSGCGHKDGAEITEAASALISLAEADAQYSIFAPDIEFTVHHPISNDVLAEKRNVLLESARIARGVIRPLSELRAADFDALTLPGGSGAALNLCTWGREGAKCSVLPDVERILREFYSTEKPICAICIAPALIARVLGREGVTVTIGNDAETAAEIAKTGAHHEVCAVDDFITDRDHRIITTPAYMYGGASPFQIYTGVRKAIRELVEMA